MKHARAHKLWARVARRQKGALPSRSNSSSRRRSRHAPFEPRLPALTLRYHLVLVGLTALAGGGPGALGVSFPAGAGSLAVGGAGLHQRGDR